MGQIQYSEKYFDDIYEYRHVVLPPEVAKMLPKNRLLSESFNLLPLSSEVADKTSLKLSLNSLDCNYGADDLLWVIGGNGLMQIDYFVDCYHSGADDRLWVIGGTVSGTLGYFPIDYSSSGAIGYPEAILEGGHAGVVRTVLPVSHINGSIAQSRAVFGWTGGEDGRLCCWLSDESFQANRSWITSTLVVKSPPRSRGKNRHHPY